jgi:hypothetical protein
VDRLDFHQPHERDHIAATGILLIAREPYRQGIRRREEALQVKFADTAHKDAIGHQDRHCAHSTDSSETGEAGEDPALKLILSKLIETIRMILKEHFLWQMAYCFELKGSPRRFPA